MKIKAIGLFVLFFMVSGYCKPQFGLDFSVGSSLFVGPTIRFSHFYELKPSCAITITHIDNIIGVIINNNFYLKDIDKLQNYIGLGVGYENDLVSNLNSDGIFVISGNYGLRYNINDIFGFYGEIGILIGINPMLITTAKSGLGITFYLPSTN